MQLVTCCRRLTVTNSLECIFPVFVATPPVLCGDNRACQFAPYNSCYPRHKVRRRWRWWWMGESFCFLVSHYLQRLVR